MFFIPWVPRKTNSKLSYVSLGTVVMYSELTFSHLITVTLLCYEVIFVL